MNIIQKKLPENATAADMYHMLKSPEIRKLSEAAGRTIAIQAYVLYDDEKGTTEEGEVIAQRILSIKDADGTVYATNSQTFVRDFEDMISMFSDFGDEVHAVTVKEGRSRNGRSFLNCVYAG